MTATLRLFWIEARRSTAIWFLPIVLGITWYAASEPDAYHVTLWSKTSAQVGQALIALGPLIGGLAAWVAGRDRRRGIDDLLATAPRSPVTRDLLGYASTTTWGLLAYLMAIAAVFAVTARAATWGSPDFLPVGASLATLVLSAAVGYAAGLWVPGRFTPALASTALILVLVIPVNIRDQTGQNTSFQSNIRFLTPWTFVDPGNYDPFYDSWPNVAAPLFAWLFGLTGIALVAIAILHWRKPVTWGLLLVAVIATSVAGTTLQGIETAGWAEEARPSYEPLCKVEASTTICVHPAYAGYLDPAANLVDSLVRPVSGLPGVPTRVEQVLFSPNEPPDGTIQTHFYNWIYNGDWGRAADAEGIVRQIICESGCNFNPGSGYRFGDPARSTVGVWLLKQAGIEPGLMPPPRPGQEHAREQLAEAQERFAALDPDERRAWFEQNFVNLRAGRLTLGDLP